MRSNTDIILDAVNRGHTTSVSICAETGMKSADVSRALMCLAEAGRIISTGEFVMTDRPGRPARVYQRCPEGSMTAPKTNPKLRRWTTSEQAELLRLCEEARMNWQQIAQALGRTMDAVTSKYHELKKGIVRDKPIGRKKNVLQNPTEKMRLPWSDQDMTTAQGLWRDLLVDAHNNTGDQTIRKAVFDTIGRAVDRSPAAVEARLRIYGASFGLTWGSMPTRPNPHEEQLLQRAKARLAAAASRNLTAALLGDPPPGYSALDQRSSHHGPPRSKYERVAPPITLSTGAER